MPMLPNYATPKAGEEVMDLVATHQRCLIAAALRTHGPILELGVGWYSTPLLHEIAKVQGRALWTYDNNMGWLMQFMCLRSLSAKVKGAREGFYHHLLRVGWWGELVGGEQIDEGTHFGLCFVDNGQPCEREYCTRLLLEKCKVDVFVFHDTEEAFAYGYERILGNNLHNSADPNRTYGMFKYQYTDRCQNAWTTIASNTVDVREWGMIDLPPVEPTREVT